MSYGPPSNLAALAAMTLLLSACGAGSSPFSSPSTETSSDTPAEQTPPAQDYRRHYQGLGLQPKELERDLLVDDAVASAIAPGYLGFATLMATMDLRMPLQAYEWYLPRAIRRTGEIRAEGTEEAPYPGRRNATCADTNSAGDVLGSGEATIFYWRNSDGSTHSDGAPSLSLGEEIRFGFNDCVPTSTAARFESDGLAVPRPRVQRYMQVAAGNGEPHYRFSFDGATLNHYPGFTISGGPLVRHTIGPNAEMTLSNAVLDADEAPGTLALSGTASGRTVTVYVQGRDRDASTPVSQMRSLLAPAPPQHLDFTVPLLNVGLDISGEDSPLEGTYHFSTNGARVPFHSAAGLAAGGFTVVRPATGATYTFSLDADPNFLWVEIDEDGDGTVDASGRISKPFVTGRLALSAR
jgi:hypothetical protein